VDGLEIHLAEACHFRGGEQLLGLCVPHHVDNS
jgi:hypothetical protein